MNEQWLEKIGKPAERKAKQQIVNHPHQTSHTFSVCTSWVPSHTSWLSLAHLYCASIFHASTALDVCCQDNHSLGFSKCVWRRSENRSCIVGHPNSNSINCYSCCSPGQPRLPAYSGWDDQKKPAGRLDKPTINRVASKSQHPDNWCVTTPISLMGGRDRSALGETENIQFSTGFRETLVCDDETRGMTKWNAGITSLLKKRGRRLCPAK